MATPGELINEIHIRNQRMKEMQEKTGLPVAGLDQADILSLMEKAAKQQAALPPKLQRINLSKFMSEREDRLNALQENATKRRQALLADQATASQQQQGLTAQLTDAAAGGGPSVAQAQMGIGRQAALGGAAGLQGAGGGLLGARLAQQALGGQGMANVTQAAQGRAGEQTRAQQQLAGILAERRGADAGLQTDALERSLQMRGVQDRSQFGRTGLEQEANLRQLELDMAKKARLRAVAHGNKAIDRANAQLGREAIGGATAAAGSLLQTFAESDSKKDEKK
jgi:hypothetical protein